MKQQSTECAVDEWGNLVNAEDFRSPSFWKLYCFHCGGPVVLVFTPNGQVSNFLHDETFMTSDYFVACPNVECSRPQEPTSKAENEPFGHAFPPF
ncbi:hypothetical protein AAHY91_19995 [Klebsiella pneumoniae]|uniref:DUF7828 domain-containing protein n=1 Tax=Klebsiella pneumoniae TaxID=573 RepID=UPI003311B0AF|nr:hypothetical protein [Klebsiella pneumoniae]HBW3140494.1 hypothetical protein [Klebsiella pneumoniae]HBW3981499.1 hypothetical protein [Klebsiella pneumoniae]HDH0604435.1 hypothetical protein [Klebsiella pneumoniae]